MSNDISSQAKAVVRRNTEEVQGQGNFDVFEELFADDFLDHTPQPNMTPDKSGARGLYRALREAFPDFRAVIHWQTAEGEAVTTFKTSIWDTQRNVSRHPADRQGDPFRDGRRHACPQWTHQGALGCCESLIP